nr:hypothetical protein Iba_chr12aCG8840 [Ipomoea batatas]
MFGETVMSLEEMPSTESMAWRSPAANMVRQSAPVPQPVGDENQAGFGNPNPNAIPAAIPTGEQPANLVLPSENVSYLDTDIHIPIPTNEHTLHEVPVVAPNQTNETADTEMVAVHQPRRSARLAAPRQGPRAKYLNNCLLVTNSVTAVCILFSSIVISTTPCCQLKHEIRFCILLHPFFISTLPRLFVSPHSAVFVDSDEQRKIDGYIISITDICYELNV